MRTEEEIRADARPRSPFSNHTEFDLWAEDRCHVCENDRAEEEVYCPILGVAIAGGVTPAEWTTRQHAWQIGDASGSVEVVDDCTAFVERTHFPGDPEEPEERPVETVHIPVLDGQLDLFGGGS